LQEKARYLVRRFSRTAKKFITGPYAEIESPEAVRQAIAKGTRLKLKLSQIQSSDNKEFLASGKSASSPDQEEPNFSSVAKQMRTLFKQTQQEEPSSRPTFSSIITTISQAYNSVLLPK